MSGIYEIKDYSQWSPQTQNTLDLRLASKAGPIIAQKAQEMGLNLENLYTQAADISPHVFIEVKQYCLNLKVLNLCGARGLTDESLKVISEFSKLEELNLDFAKKRHRGEISDVDVKNILNKCSNLKKLDLSGTKITNLTLHKIGLKKNITFLRVVECSQLKLGSIHSLSKERPDMTIVKDKDDRYDAESQYLKLSENVKDRFGKKEDDFQIKEDDFQIKIEVTADENKE